MFSGQSKPRDPFELGDVLDPGGTSLFALGIVERARLVMQARESCGDHGRRLPIDRALVLLRRAVFDAGIYSLPAIKKAVSARLDGALPEAHLTLTARIAFHCDGDPVIDGTGEDEDHAVTIRMADGRTAVHFERTWVRRRFEADGMRGERTNQRLVRTGDRYFDKIFFAMNDGTVRVIWFEISSLFEGGRCRTTFPLGWST